MSRAESETAPSGPRLSGAGEARTAFVAAYRGAVQGGDAYRHTRVALRLEGDLLRVGNRFVGVERYREIAFVAVGNAAVSQAMAALAALGDRITQGFVASPFEPPPSIPFRSERLTRGPNLASDDGSAAAAALELTGELGPRDLLLVLLSPGALGALSLPPPEMGAAAWNAFVRALAEAGAAPPEVASVVRTLAGGAVGGALGRAAGGADVDTLVVDRGSGGATVGGGPTRPVSDAERRAAGAVVARAGLVGELPPRVRARLESAPADAVARTLDSVHRPVVVAAPGDALRGASDALVARRWIARLGALSMPDAPGLAAERLLERVETLVREVPRSALRPDVGRGLAVFAGLELGVPEGLDEGPALARFLVAARARIARRGSTVGVFRTFGGTEAGPDASGGFVGVDFTDRDTTTRPERSLAMRRGITDVGCLAVVLIPAEDARGRPVVRPPPEPARLSETAMRMAMAEVRGPVPPDLDDAYRLFDGERE